MDALVHPRAVGFARLLDTLAITVKVPAVEGAAQTVVFQPAIAQVGTAVRTGAPNQAQLTVTVTKQYKVFTQQLDWHNWAIACQFITNCCRLPIVTHNRACVAAWAGTGQQIVKFLADHGVS